MQPLQDMQIRDDPKKGLHDVRSFVGACNFYRRHIQNFTYSSAPLTDLIKKTTPWRWTSREEECFQELKKKIASSNCLGVPRPECEIVLITDASDVGGGGTIYQWQELNPAELTHCKWTRSCLFILSRQFCSSKSRCKIFPVSSSTFPRVSLRAQKGRSMTFIQDSSFRIFVSHRTQQCSICMPAGETCWHATQNLKI